MFDDFPAPAERLDPNEDHLLASFDRGKSEEGTEFSIRCTWNCYNGNHSIGLRTWFKGNDGCWRPTKKGAGIRIDEIEALEKALEQAKKLRYNAKSMG